MSQQPPSGGPWGVRLRWHREHERQETREEFAEAVNELARELGENVGCGERLVARWEDGEIRSPRPVYRRVLAALGAPLPIAMPATWRRHAAPPSVVDEDEREEDDPVRRRAFVGAVAGVTVGALVDGIEQWLPRPAHGLAPVPARVGLADVAQLRALTDELRNLDQRYGGGAALDAARGFLGWSSGMLAARCDVPTEKALRVALADLNSLVGWAFHDAGKQTAARQHLTQALVLAREVEADGLVASVLYRLGRVSLHRRHPRDALRLFQLGQLAAQDAGNPAEAARLHANEAWAYALLGQQRQVGDALARAEHEMGRVDPATADPWTRVFFAAGDFIGHRALVYSVLAAATPDPTKAQRYAEAAADLAATALADSGPDRPPRSRVFDHIVLATCQLRAGDVDAGLATADETVTFTETLRSARAVERLGEIAAAADRWSSTHPEVREVRHRIAASGAA